MGHWPSTSHHKLTPNNGGPGLGGRSVAIVVGSDCVLHSKDPLQWEL